MMLIMALSNAYGQQSSITVKCPPCRPIESCDQCFATQEEANSNCNSSSRVKGLSLENELTDLELSVYPNPSSGLFKIEGEALLEGEIQLFSATGELIQTRRILSPIRKSSIGEEKGLPQGVYILMYTDKEGKSVSKKLVVDY